MAESDSRKHLRLGCSEGQQIRTDTDCFSLFLLAAKFNTELELVCDSSFSFRVTEYDSCGFGCSVKQRVCARVRFGNLCMTDQR